MIDAADGFASNLPAMSMGPAVTMETIAEAAGVSRGTVSKALRDDPSISKARRAEIKAISASLGYQPHPMVAALMSQLHQGRRRSDPCRIAWIDLWAEADEPDRGHDPGRCLRGAERQAHSLGYDLDVYHPAKEGICPARLEQILATRSEWGVIFPAVPKSAAFYPFDIGPFTGVTIGTSLHEPRIHRVAHNHYQGAMLACQNLRDHGFKRIGLALSPWADERTDRKWRAAFMVEQQSWAPADRVPPLLVTSEREGEFRRWIGHHRPDALLLADADAHLQSWLAAPEFKESMRLVSLARREPMEPGWGIDPCPERIGASAVDLVVGQIHRNERGPPPVPHDLLIDGIWVEN